MDYRVQLDVFNGPLDLLLYLIKRDELDIYDIPIARITDSYMHYVRGLRDMHDRHGLDINVAGDFMVMAATLMEIKSAMLLPRHEEQPGEGQRSTAEEIADPRLGLVRQLLEYKRLKDQAALLERQRQLHEARFPRIPVLPEIASDEPPPLDMDEVQIWDLLEAFNRLMKDIGGTLKRSRFHEVAYDDTPIELHAADIEDRLRRERRVTLRLLMEGRATRSEMIGVFLALLELVRQKKVLLHLLDGEEIELEDAPDEHRRTYAAEANRPTTVPDDQPVDDLPEAPVEPEPVALNGPAKSPGEDQANLTAEPG